jgi:hypothetical protein
LAPQPLASPPPGDQKRKGSGAASSSGLTASLRPPVKLIYRGHFRKSVFERGVLHLTGTIYRPCGRLL